MFYKQMKKAWKPLTSWTPQWFWHFIISIIDPTNMHPVTHWHAAQLVAISFLWCGKIKSLSSTMNIELDAEIMGTHCTTLYVPTGPPMTSRAVPIGFTRLWSLCRKNIKTVTCTNITNTGNVSRIFTFHSAKSCGSRFLGSGVTKRSCREFPDK